MSEVECSDSSLATGALGDEFGEIFRSSRPALLLRLSYVLVWVPPPTVRIVTLLVPGVQAFCISL